MLWALWRLERRILIASQRCAVCQPPTCARVAPKCRRWLTRMTEPPPPSSFWGFAEELRLPLLFASQVQEDAQFAQLTPAPTMELGWSRWAAPQSPHDGFFRATRRWTVDRACRQPLRAQGGRTVTGGSQGTSVSGSKARFQVLRCFFATLASCFCVCALSLFAGKWKRFSSHLLLERTPLEPSGPTT